MTICAIYTRISADKGKGTDDAGLAVERQETLVRKMLDRKGWTAGQLYVDNDVSAAGKVKRPAYEQMLLDYQAGEFEAIAAYDLDRLWRVPSEFEALLELSEKQGLLLATVGGDADLSTSNGRLYARIKVAVAKDELEKRSARQKAKFAQNRMAGKNHWQGRRPFGLELDGTLNQREAEAIRHVADMLLGGATQAACMAYLDENEIRTTWGNPWKREPFKRTLLHPRLIAKLEHEGELIPGNWEPVLDEDTWRAVGQVLKTRASRAVKQTEREYTLSGVARCAECGSSVYGSVMRVANKEKYGNRSTQYAYRCATTPKHFSKSLPRTEEYIRDATLLVLAMPGAEESFTSQASAESLRALRIARAAEVNHWEEWLTEAAENGLRPSEYKRPRAAHEERLKELDVDILAHEKESVLGDALKLLPRLTGASDEYRAKLWDDIPLERRRRILNTVWDRVLLYKGGANKRFDPATIEMIPSKATMKAQQIAADRLLTNAIEHAEKLGMR